VEIQCGKGVECPIARSLFCLPAQSGRTTFNNQVWALVCTVINAATKIFHVFPFDFFGAFIISAVYCMGSP